MLGDLASSQSLPRTYTRSTRAPRPPRRPVPRRSDKRHAEERVGSRCRPLSPMEARTLRAVDGQTGSAKGTSNLLGLQFGLRLLQPVRHAHLAVNRRRGGEMLLRLLAIPRALVELAEAEVAVGDERAHAESLGDV